MNSCLIFLILATAFVSVPCDDLRSKTAVSVNEVVKTDCTSEFRQALRNTIRNVTCKPRYRHVSLTPTPGQEFNVSEVFVPQCGGQCGAYTICEPTATRIIQAPVTVLTSNEEDMLQQNQCTVANVEEHVTCGCKCKHKATDCNAQQEYRESHCACVCKNREMQKQNCKVQDQKVWDDEDCACKCAAKITDCTTGYIWNSDHCKCVQVNDD